MRALAFTPPAPRAEGSKAAAVARNRAGRLFCLVRRGHSGRALSRPAHVRPSLQLHSLSPVCGRPIACSSAFYIGIARAAPAAAPYCSRRNGSQTACCSPTKAGPVAVHARDAWGRARQRFMLIGHRLMDFSSIPDTLRFRATRIPRRRKRTLAHIPSTPGSTRTKANLDRERAIYHASGRIFCGQGRRPSANAFVLDAFSPNKYGTRSGKHLRGYAPRSQPHHQLLRSANPHLRLSRLQ